MSSGSRRVLTTGVHTTQVETFADIPAAIPSPVLNQLVYVNTTTNPFPWITRLNKGTYKWDGSNWIFEGDEILDEIAESNDTDEFITTDYTLPDSTTFVGTLRIKNVGTADVNINTLAADKFEGEDTQIIFPGDAYTIKVYQANDYRIM